MREKEKGECEECAPSLSFSLSVVICQRSFTAHCVSFDELSAAERRNRERGEKEKPRKRHIHTHTHTRFSSPLSPFLLSPFPLSLSLYLSLSLSHRAPLLTPFDSSTPPHTGASCRSPLRGLQRRPPRRRRRRRPCTRASLCGCVAAESAVCLWDAATALGLEEKRRFFLKGEKRRQRR